VGREGAGDVGSVSGDGVGGTVVMPRRVVGQASDPLRQPPPPARHPGYPPPKVRMDRGGIPGVAPGDGLEHRAPGTGSATAQRDRI
jgi:hypothetical protein